MPRQLVSSLSYSLISIGDDVQPANSSPHPQTLPVQMYKCSPSQKGDGFLLLFNPMELEAVKSERGDHFMKEGAWAVPPSQMVDLCHLQDFSHFSRKLRCTALQPLHQSHPGSVGGVIHSLGPCCGYQIDVNACERLLPPVGGEIPIRPRHDSDRGWGREEDKTGP